MTKRDIKFRQWSERNKEMTTWDRMVKRRLWIDILTYDDRITEEYTGLKDVNGVEIYEGDIVKVHVIILSPDDKIGIVNYTTKYGFSLLFDGNRVARQGDWTTDDKAEYEVIGNIHENPELLEV